MLRQTVRFLWREKTAHGVIFVGGALGALFRYACGFVFEGTLAQVLFCNILGTFVLAALFEVGERVHPHVKNLVSTGFSGGLSTFATFSKDSVLALQAGDYFTFWTNAALNFGLCLGVFITVGIIADSSRRQRAALRRRRIKMLSHLRGRLKNSNSKGGRK